MFFFYNQFFVLVVDVLQMKKNFRFIFKMKTQLLSSVLRKKLLFIYSRTFCIIRVFIVFNNINISNKSLQVIFKNISDQILNNYMYLFIYVYKRFSYKNIILKSHSRLHVCSKFIDY